MGTRKPSYLSLTDLFCGAGGASIGAEAAGLKLALGVNHWQTAIETHAQNFPHAAHDCRDVSETHPSRYGSTHLLWASPECPTWSQARGKRRNFLGQLALDEEFEALPTEAEEKSRVTMWDVVRYSEYHHYEAVVVENVVDLMPWYLLPTWLNAMEVLGYAHKPVFLNSMFFGVPQSRDRVYFVFWKKNNKAPDLEFHPQSWCLTCERIVEGIQTWKNPAKRAGRYRAQYIYICPACGKEAYPYVMPAASVIDWSVKGERIGDRKRPLAPATRARIQAGVDRYWRRPVVMDTLRSSKLRDPEDSPLPTQTARQSLALSTPPLVAHLRGTHDNAIDTSTKSASEPMGTITGGGIHHGVVEGPEPLVIRHYTARGDEGQMSHPAGHPLGTITGSDHHSVLQPPLAVELDKQYAGHTARRVKPADVEPVATFTSDGHVGIVVPTRGPGAHRVWSARPVGLPFATQLGEIDRGLLVHPGSGGSGRVRSTNEQLPTQTTETAPMLVTPPLVVPTDQQRKGPRLRSRTAEEPLRTQTTGQNDVLITPPLIAKAAGSTYDPGEYKRIRPAGDNPLWTQTGTAETALVEAPEAFLASYYGQGGERPVEQPMSTLTGRHRHALVEGLDDIDIDDCFFRMLMHTEIGLGMAFPEQSSYPVAGNQRAIVKQYGQGVTPPVPAAIWPRILESLK